MWQGGCLTVGTSDDRSVIPQGTHQSSFDREVCWAVPAVSGTEWTGIAWSPEVVLLMVLVQGPFGLCSRCTVRPALPWLSASCSAALASLLLVVRPRPSLLGAERKQRMLLESSAVPSLQPHWHCQTNGVYISYAPCLDDLPRRLHAVQEQLIER